MIKTEFIYITPDGKKFDCAVKAAKYERTVALKDLSQILKDFIQIKLNCDFEKDQLKFNKEVALIANLMLTHRIEIFNILQDSESRIYGIDGWLYEHSGDKHANKNEDDEDGVLYKSKTPTMRKRSKRKRSKRKILTRRLLDDEEDEDEL